MISASGRLYSWFYLVGSPFPPLALPLPLLAVEEHVLGPTL